MDQGEGERGSGEKKRDVKERGKEGRKEEGRRRREEGGGGRREGLGRKKVGRGRRTPRKHLTKKKDTICEFPIQGPVDPGDYEISVQIFDKFSRPKNPRVSKVLVTGGEKSAKIIQNHLTYV
jgi:hypothetical protein